jgi:hypothetical protein
VRASFGTTFDRYWARFDHTARIKLTGGPAYNRDIHDPMSLATFLGAWAEVTLQPIDPLSITIGLRGDHFHLFRDVHHTSGDPRLSVKWTESERLSLRASIGMYHQPPTFIIALPVVDVASVRSGLQEGTQISGGFTWKVWEDLELSIDAYFNPLGRVVEVGFVDEDGRRTGVDPTQPDAPARAVTSSSTGLSYGLDLMLRWPLKGRFFGWVTLSLQRSQRWREVVANGQRRYFDLPYAFDQTLVANGVFSVRLPYGFSAGIVVHFNTGRPELGDFGSRTRRAVNNVWVSQPHKLVDRFPPFFRLDVRVSKVWLADWFSAELYLDVLNVTVMQEVLGYDYDGGGAQPLTKTAETVPVIIPSLGLRVRY